MREWIFAGFSFYEALYYFVIYAFLGWCMEVFYAALNTGKFINRGFLNGPYCPIYGFGMLLVVVLLSQIADNSVLLFFGSTILTSLLEYISGVILMRVFQSKWWDYSDMPFNIKGYVCLKFSLIWGAGCVVIIKVVHPVISRLVAIIPPIVGEVFVLTFITVIVIDTAATFGAVFKLNTKLGQLEDISLKLRHGSEVLGENLSEEAIALKLKYDEIIKQSRLFSSRMIKAFPNLHSFRYTDALSDLKKSLKIKR